MNISLTEREIENWDLENQKVTKTGSIEKN